MRLLASLSARPLLYNESRIALENMPMNMQRPMVSMNTVMVAKRSSDVSCGIEIGLSVIRKSTARPDAMAVQTRAVCHGVERNELKAKTTNNVHRNTTPTSGAM